MDYTSMLNQTAVLWAAPAKDGFGEPTFSAPSEIDVRWEQRSVEFIDMAGVRQVSRAVVYSNSSVPLDGYLFEGTLGDLDSASEEDPREQYNAYIVRDVQRSVSLDGDTYLYKVLL